LMWLGLRVGLFEEDGLYIGNDSTGTPI
jgi:hypothetical protein